MDKDEVIPRRKTMGEYIVEQENRNHPLWTCNSCGGGHPTRHCKPSYTVPQKQNFNKS